MTETGKFSPEPERKRVKGKLDIPFEKGYVINGVLGIAYERDKKRNKQIFIVRDANTSLLVIENNSRSRLYPGNGVILGLLPKPTYLSHFSSATVGEDEFVITARRIEEPNLLRVTIETSHDSLNRGKEVAANELVSHMYELRDKATSSSESS